jgi:hypothetical protein
VTGGGEGHPGVSACRVEPRLGVAKGLPPRLLPRLPTVAGRSAARVLGWISAMISSPLASRASASVNRSPPPLAGCPARPTPRLRLPPGTRLLPRAPTVAGRAIARTCGPPLS